MVIDEASLLTGIADDVELLNEDRLDFVQPFKRIKPVVATVHKEVGDIEQQATVAAATEFIQELCFGEITLQLDVSGDVFQQERFAATLSQLERVVGDDLHEFAGRAHRVQMAKVGFGGAGEGDVFADPFGTASRGDLGKLSQPLVIQRARRTETEAEAVDETT